MKSLKLLYVFVDYWIVQAVKVKAVLKLFPKGNSATVFLIFQVSLTEYGAKDSPLKALFVLVLNINGGLFLRNPRRGSNV